MFRKLLVSLVATLALAPAAARADQKSEDAAAELLHRRLQHEDPTQAQLLGLVHGKDVVVVAGSMDHVENVLTSAKIKHTLIQPAQVAQADLRSNMIVMVDCPGVMPEAGVKRLEKFVRAGGLLYTTDWALRNVVEKGFPGTIAATGGSTGSEVVPVKMDSSKENIMTKVLLRKGSSPQWWLEGGSFPIKVLDKQNVEVLAHSDEMGKKYGSSPIVVRFKWEDGEVIHVVSHFYRQMQTNGPAVAAAAAVDQFEGLSDKDKQALKKGNIGGGSSVGDVESSYAFQRMTSNIVTGKAKRNEELGRIYNMTVKPKTPAPALRSAPEATAPAVAAPAPTPGTRMKVLDRKENQVRVRDDRGYEGWVPADSLQAN
jgi:hypothetical protein